MHSSVVILSDQPISGNNINKFPHPRTTFLTKKPPSPLPLGQFGSDEWNLSQSAVFQGTSK